MGEVIQLQGDQRKDVQEFLVDKKEGLELDAKTIKVRRNLFICKIKHELTTCRSMGSRVRRHARPGPSRQIYPPRGSIEVLSFVSIPPDAPG
jgi:hypothetical protein